MTVFQAARQISCNDAAEKLGLRGQRTGSGKGVWCCPFHQDNTPSMTCFDKDNRYYCFSCHASGDAASLYAKVLGLRPVEGAKAALQAFGLDVPEQDKPQGPFLRPERIRRGVLAVQRQFRKGLAAMIQAKADAMTLCMEKSPDPDSWLWNAALQHACKVQEEVHRLEGLTDEEFALEIAQTLSEGKLPTWGEDVPTPGMNAFLAIITDLMKIDPDFLNAAERKEVLNKLLWCPPPKEVQQARLAALQTEQLSLLPSTKAV